jgi:ATP-dependent Clp protease ATP-binding subunit ClpA
VGLAADMPPEGASRRQTTLSSEQFTQEAWRIVLLAADWARLQRSPHLRSPHLFAALVGDGTGPLGTLLRRGGIDPEVAKIHILMMIPFSAEAEYPSHVSIGPNVGKTLLRAIESARDRGRQEASVEDVTESFLADGGGAVGERLRQLGVDTTPWWYGHGRGDRGGNGNGRPGKRF